MTASSKHPEEAAALAAWLTSPENQLAFAKLVNILPSTPGSLSDPHFTDPAPTEDPAEAKLDEARRISAGSLSTAVAFTPALGTWPDLRRAFEEGIKPALLGGKDVREALAEIEAQWNRILDAAIPADLEAVPRPEPVSPTEPIAEAPR